MLVTSRLALDFKPDSAPHLTQASLLVSSSADLEALNSSQRRSSYSSGSGVTLSDAWTSQGNQVPSRRTAKSL